MDLNPNFLLWTFLVAAVFFIWLLRDFLSLKLVELAIALVKGEKRLSILNLLNEKYSGSRSERREPSYESLTPTDNADEDGHYGSALLWGVEDPKITNIAVTGGYGSGKSSVLNTFIKRHKHKFRFLKISLATFDEARIKKDEMSSEEYEELRLSVERSILQQLFYSVDQSTIPRSRFKRITNPTKRSVREAVMFFFTTAFFGLYLYFSDDPFFKIFTRSEWFDSYAKGMLLILGYLATMYFYGLFLTIKELKFKFRDAEINLRNGGAHSIINDHIDEILYFFECTQFRIIIIEDLDRFNDPEIFVRLRELNYLINKSRGEENRVIFIYAIKDQMFKDKDRAKFFDFIVPIIPVVNPTNAYDKIIERYDVSSIDKKFLARVCLYFDDLRLIHNIFNEFQLYSRKLEKLNFDPEKLLSIIVYKNFHPEEFSKLHSNEGQIYEIFNNQKKNLKFALKSSIEDSIKLIEKSVEKSSSEMLSNIEDLNKLYLIKVWGLVFSKRINFPLRGNISNLKVSLSVGGSEFDLKEAERKENFELFRKEEAGEICFYYGDSRQTQVQITFQEIESLVGGPDYDSRFNNISIKSRIKEKNNKIKELEAEISELDSLSLKGLMKRSNSEFFSDKEPEILKYLVRSGYIDESYLNYISIFYESAITLSDKEFALSVANRVGLQFDYSLSKIGELLDRFLDEESLRSHCVLNFDLISYLIKNKKFHSLHYSWVMDLITRDNEISKKFIVEYLLWKGAETSFMNCLLNEDPKIINSSIVGNKNDSEILKEWLPLIDKEFYDKAEICIELKSAIELSSDPLLAISSEQLLINNSESFIKKVQPTIDELHLNGISGPVFDMVCQLRCFLVSRDNIELIVSRYLSVPMESVRNTYSQRPFDILLNRAPEYIKDDFFERPRLYLEKFFTEFETIVDSENLVSDFINEHGAKIGQTSVISLVSRLGFEFYDLKTIDDQSLWTIFVRESKVVASWENVISFYNISKEFSSELSDYFNDENHSSKLSGAKKEQYKAAFSSGEEIKCFEASFIKSQKIDDSVFEGIAPLLESVWTSIDISNLSEERLECLLVNRKLSVSQENYESLKDRGFHQLFGLFVLVDVEGFLKLVSSEKVSIDEDVLLSLSEDKNLSEVQKIKILCSVDFNNFELPNAFYETVSNVCLSQRAPFELLEKLFPVLPHDSLKRSIFLFNIGELENSQINYLLSFIPDFLDFSASDGYSIVHIDNSESNKQFVRQLYQSGFITKPSIPKIDVLGIKSIKIKRRLK